MTGTLRKFPHCPRLVPVTLVGLAKGVKYSEGLMGLIIFLEGLT